MVVNHISGYTVHAQSPGLAAFCSNKPLLYEPMLALIFPSLSIMNVRICSSYKQQSDREVLVI